MLSHLEVETEAAGALLESLDASKEAGVSVVAPQEVLSILQLYTNFSSFHATSCNVIIKNRSSAALI